MNRGRDRKQVKLDDQQHYKELEESNIKNENNRKKEYLRGYRSSRRRINRIDDEITELKELAASVKAIDYSGMPHGSGNQKDLSDE